MSTEQYLNNQELNLADTQDGVGDPVDAVAEALSVAPENPTVFSHTEEYVPVQNIEVNGIVLSSENEGITEFSGPLAYGEQHIEINGEAASANVFEFSPDMATEWDRLNPEEKAESVELIQESIILVDLSEAGNEEARTAANISMLGTEFAFAEASPFDDEQQVSELTESEGEKQTFVKHMLSVVSGAAGKTARLTALATLFGVALVGPMKTAEARAPESGGVVVINKIFKNVDSAMKGTESLQKISHEQERNNLRIEALEQEKRELVRRTSGDTRLNQIQNSGENRAATVRIEANYKADKARLAARRASAESYFLRHNIRNLPGADFRAYEAELAQIDASEAQVDARYEINRARENMRVENSNARIDRAAGNLNNRISQIEMQQEDLRLKNDQLETKKPQGTWKTTQDIMKPWLK